MISASKLYRLSICPGSEALPQVTREDDPVSREGTVIHEYLANAFGGVETEPLALVPFDYRDRCAAIDLDALDLPYKNTFVETAFAYRPDTEQSRIVGNRILRKYKLTPGEIGCTADMYHIVKPQQVRIVEVKTGQNVGPAYDNLQLRMQALCIAKAHQLTEPVRAEIAYLQSDGSWEFDKTEFTQAALPEIADQIREIVAAVHLEQTRPLSPNVVEGSHCKYCPAFAHCPAKRSLAVAMATELALPTITDLVRREDAGRIYERLKSYDEIAERVKKVIYEMAREEAIPLPSGKSLMEVAQTRETVDGAIALEVLQTKYGSAVACKAVQPTTSKAALDRVLGKESKSALALIDAAGGINRKTYLMVKER